MDGSRYDEAAGSAWERGDQVMKSLAKWTGALLALLVGLASTARAQTTDVVSVAVGGGQPDGGTALDYVSISGDGRYVAFPSNATNLVAGGTSGTQVFVRDRQTAVTELVSVSTGGGSANGLCRCPRISADGRFVVFSSNASNLVAGDINGFTDVFVRDRLAGTTVQANVDGAAVPADLGQEAALYSHTISPDGRYVAFQSPATNLVPGDTNGVLDDFVKDMQTGAIERVSVATGGVQANGSSTGRTLVSADGRYAVVTSSASNLVAGDANGTGDVFLRDRQSDTTQFVSISTTSTLGNGLSIGSSMTPDGRYVVFHSLASNLVSGDTNGTWDVFLRDRQSGTTERVGVSSCGSEGNNISFSHQAITDDGRYVAFSSSANNIVPDDTNGSRDVFLKDRQSGVTTRASLSSGGAQGSAGGATVSPPALSADGLHIAFSSDSSFVPGFVGNMTYVRTRGDTWGFTRFCFPGQDGILPCPCGNPPNGAGRSCNNFGVGPEESSRLRGTGQPSLSNDTIVLMSDGENNFSLTVFWQGKSPTSTTGIAHGAGVRCVNTTLRRLYTGAASGGAISRPGASDLSVSLRTSAVGQPISCGETRHYFNIYRDPQAAGPCGNPSSTINLTNAGSITWSP
jgi:Tol biopolymer transport system component